jgi:hypothetical protein
MEYVLSFLGLPSSVGQNIHSALKSAYWHLRNHFVPHHSNNYHPHILGHRSLALLSGLLISVKIFSIGLLSFGPVESAFSSAINSENIISLTNASRISFGLTELKANSVLAKAAQSKADDMLEKGYFSHNTPDGKTPWDFIAAAGYSYLSAGENLAVNFVEAEDVENAWMNSPGHKANILNQTFQEIGIGISQGEYQGKNAIFVVQMFGSPVAQKVTLDNKPTVVAPAGEVAQKQETKNVTEVIKSAKQSPALTETQTSLKPLSAQEPAVENLVTKESSFAQEAGNLQLTAEFLGSPIKVLAKFGQRAIMLLPQNDGSWFGEVKLAELTSQNAGLVLEAQDIHGVKVNAQIGNFAGSTQANFNPSVAVVSENPAVNFFGKVIHPKNMEQQFYLVFAALLISCLILAIAIKRHVQHLPLVANTALVVILAVGLWMR